MLARAITHSHIESICARPEFSVLPGLMYLPTITQLVEMLALELTAYDAINEQIEHAEVGHFSISALKVKKTKSEKTIKQLEILLNAQFQVAKVALNFQLHKDPSHITQQNIKIASYQFALAHFRKENSSDSTLVQQRLIASLQHERNKFQCQKIAARSIFLERPGLRYVPAIAEMIEQLAFYLARAEQLSDEMLELRHKENVTTKSLVTLQKDQETNAAMILKLEAALQSQCNKYHQRQVTGHSLTITSQIIKITSYQDALSALAHSTDVTTESKVKQLLEKELKQLSQLKRESANPRKIIRAIATKLENKSTFIEKILLLIQKINAYHDLTILEKLLDLCIKTIEAADREQNLEALIETKKFAKKGVEYKSTALQNKSEDDLIVADKALRVVVKKLKFEASSLNEKNKNAWERWKTRYPTLFTTGCPFDSASSPLTAPAAPESFRRSQSV